MRSLAIVTCLAIVGGALPAHAQWGSLLDKAQQNAKKAASQAVDEATKPPPPAKAAPPPATAPVAKDKGSGSGASAPAEAAAPATSATSDVAPGEVYSARYDFIPGDRIFFFDDFSDTDVGDYPRRWTMGEGGGPVEVVEIQGKRWLMAVADEGGKGMKQSHSYVRSDLSKDYPEKFTLEFDLPSTANVCVAFAQKYWTTGSDGVCIGPTRVEMYWAGMRNDNVAASTKPLRHVAIAVSGTNVKVYYDGQRVLSHPEAVRVRHKLHAVGFRFEGSENRKRQDQRITGVKLAEGGKDYAKELVAGRIVTHGITFDTASDVIRPESGPTLRKILGLLEQNPAVAFEVQGHTDNHGGDKVNGPLSERRAQAVKAWLVKEGIDGSRLTSRGLGSTKPLQSNDTAEGRAENRRVEFVKTAG